MTSSTNEKDRRIPYYPVLIIGAGASGIAAGSQLKQKLGFEQFKIVDRQSGIGGEFRDSAFIAVFINGRR
jgi:cation diffusion facilitator CzcD-associated flavoprotein CzcO